MRCLAVALKRLPMDQHVLSFDDEKDLTFIGLVCFLYNMCSFQHYDFLLMVTILLHVVQL